MTIASKTLHAAPPDGFEIDLRALYFVLRERVWVVVLVALLAVAGAGGYLARTPKAFVASATVEIDHEAPTVLDVKAIESDAVDSVEAVKTIEAKLNTSALMRRLMRDSSIGITVEKLGLAPEAATPETMIYRLRRMLSVGLIRGTRLISVTATHGDPEFAASLANGVVAGYVRQLADERAEVARQANSYLNGESMRLKQKLRESERALQEYRETSQSASLEDKQNIVVAQLQELNAKVTEARTEQMKLAAAVAQARTWREKAPDQLLTVAAVATAPGVIEQQKRLAEMSAELATLQERYLEGHPRLIQAKSQIEQSRADLQRAIVQAAESVEVALDIATKTEQSYASALAEQEKKALALNKSAIGYKALEREVESDRAMFVAVLKRLQESDVTKGLEQGIVRLVEPAVAPERPAKPRSRLILAGAVVAGLGMGALLALLLNAGDFSLKTVDQVERTLGAHVLAAVPCASRRPGAAPLVDADEGQLAEAFRTLRTALTLHEDAPRALLFTSATENDGKTFCALNCAAALARAGSRTLLVDADLRKPAIGEALFPGESRPGLAEVLQGRTAWPEAVRETQVPGLHALTAGHTIVNPAELLHGRAFADFIAAAAKEYEYVVVDSAPLQAVSDTLLLVKAIKSVCFVLRARATHRRAAAKSCQSLLEAGAALAGIVFNRAVPRSGGYYYHYQAGTYGQDVYGAAPKRAEPLKAGEPA